MRAFIAIVGGFAFTLAVFASGLVVATWFLAAKPVQQASLGNDVTDLWTREPRTVKTPVEGLERVPARPTEPDVNSASTSSAAKSLDLVDTTVTGSTEPAVLEEQPAAEPELPDAHLEWCASRYRSYQPADNSYTPYSGGSRPCISPYLEDAGNIAEFASNADSVEEAEFVVAEDGWQGDVTAEHVDYCFSRYRSYRPEDNSYQPFGGGPRRQCE